jgi:tellurite resistance protein TehA-like permease
VIRPRLRFDIRRWSTVFPLGMAALASLHLSRVLHQPTLWGLGHVLSWLALVVWAVVAAGSLRRVISSLA